MGTGLAGLGGVWGQPGSRASRSPVARQGSVPSKLIYADASLCLEVGKPPNADMLHSTIIKCEPYKTSQRKKVVALVRNLKETHDRVLKRRNHPAQYPRASTRPCTLKPRHPLPYHRRPPHPALEIFLPLKPSTSTLKRTPKP